MTFECDGPGVMRQASPALPVLKEFISPMRTGVDLKLLARPTDAECDLLAARLGWITELMENFQADDRLDVLQPIFCPGGSGLPEDLSTMPFEKLTDVINKLGNLSSAVFAELLDAKRRPEYLQVLIESQPSLSRIKDFLDTQATDEVAALQEQLANVQNIATTLKKAKEERAKQHDDSDDSDD